MKNISLTLNIILFIAVAILYYLHFKEPKRTDEPAGSPLPAVHVSNADIVYVNSDSLLDQYDFYKSEKSQFETAQTRIKGELKSQSEKLQQEIEAYQQQGASMTDAQRAKKEEELTMKQQQLMQRKEELVAKLDEDQSKSSEQLYAKLNEYLRKHNNKYHFVLGFQKGGGILFANDSLNITKEVIEGLNREYQEQKK